MKDTNNKLSYNQWSAGEYNENTSEFQSTGTLITTKKYSHIGENSLFCVNNTNETKYVGITPAIQTTPGKTYTFTVKVYNPTQTCSILIVSNLWNTGVSYVSPSDAPKTISVSYTASSNDQSIYCRCNVSSGAYVYLDDLVLVEG